MATTAERLGVVETKVENIHEKIDDLKLDIKGVNEGLNNTKNDLTPELEKMYGASCTQHAELAKEIGELKKMKDKWTWIIAGGVGVAGFFAGHLGIIQKFLGG